jgi:amino acid transporter
MKTRHRTPSVSTRLGFAIASGVPVLVLVSMGPVAGLAGTASVLVWALSALIGFFMAIAFVSLAAAQPHITGGIGALAGSVLAPRSRLLAITVQWCYWFGWSPALALNAVLVGSYVRDAIFPASPTWIVLLIAVAVLGASVTVNHFGVRHGARAHVVLIICVAVPTILLVAAAVADGKFQPGRLAPFGPPGGWLSVGGLIAITGGLFLAGWSAYGSELALSFGTEYRRGTKDAVRTLVSMAVVSVVVYSVVPLLLVGVLGVHRIQQDPAVALRPLTHQLAGGFASLVVGVLVLALLLGVNMVMIGSSRTLYQLSRSGYAWHFLGKTNRHGVPGNALRFDLAVNTVLLLAVFAINHQHPSNTPLALLAASSVGYIMSISLALIAAWLQHRSPARTTWFLRIRPAFMHIALALAVVNLVLLLAAGFAWGWPNVLLGAAVLIAVIAVFTKRTPRRDGQAAQPVAPICIAGAVNRPVQRAGDS